MITHPQHRQLGRLLGWRKFLFCPPPPPLTTTSSGSISNAAGRMQWPSRKSFSTRSLITGATASITKITFTTTSTSSSGRRTMTMRSYMSVRDRPSHSRMFGKDGKVIPLRDPPPGSGSNADRKAMAALLLLAMVGGTIISYNNGSDNNNDNNNDNDGTQIERQRGQGT